MASLLQRVVVACFYLLVKPKKLCNSVDVESNCVVVVGGGGGMNVVF